MIKNYTSFACIIHFNRNKEKNVKKDTIKKKTKDYDKK